MRAVLCRACGSKMKRNGKTTAGRQRWRCPACGASETVRYDDEARRLAEFLEWLFSKRTQLEMPGAGRSFRRRTSGLWSVWPMPEPTGEWHRVVHVDGIHLARDLVVLIAFADSVVVSWYMARRETSRAWSALVAPVPLPAVVVTDGGSGFASAARSEWPAARVQRCLYHVFCQVRRYTTSKPNLQAGIELYGLARELLSIETLRQAEWWVERYLEWCSFWADFLEERSIVEGRLRYTRERLRKARSGLSGLLNEGAMFTYLDPELAAQGPVPSTNNPIEGGVNAQLRALLRNHRGLSLMRRVKAVFWWCHMHSEAPLGAREILERMPTDDDIDLLYRTYSSDGKREDGGPEWGDRAVWEELHHKTPYPFYID